MSEPFATVTDVINRYKLLTSEETAKAEVLLRDVSSALRIKAKECNRDLDAMMAEDEDYANVVKMVTCDIVIRRLDQDSSSNTYNLQQDRVPPCGSYVCRRLQRGAGREICAAFYRSRMYLCGSCDRD